MLLYRRHLPLISLAFSQTCTSMGIRQPWCAVQTGVLSLHGASHWGRPNLNHRLLMATWDIQMELHIPVMTDLIYRKVILISLYIKIMQNCLCCDICEFVLIVLSPPALLVTESEMLRGFLLYASPTAQMKLLHISGYRCHEDIFSPVALHTLSSYN